MVWYQGGYGDRVGIGRGYTGYPPSQLLGERYLTAKRAPEGLQGLEWVVR